MTSDAPPQQLFASLVEQSSDERRRVRKLVQQRRWNDAEPDSARLRSFNARKQARLSLPSGAESIVGSTVDYQGVSFLTEGSTIHRAVAYVEVNGVRSSELGTGFLISPRLFLTNRHVIRDVNAARGTQIVFDREMDEFGKPRPTTTYLLDPDTFAIFSDVDQLDYAVIAVGLRNSGSVAIEDFHYCILSDSPDRHVIGMNVNIVEHPGGLPKMIAIRNNLLTYCTDRTLLYETDTEPGSSGSPVFNDSWDLVALHHWGQPYLEKQDENGAPLPVTVNEGVRISAIYRDLKARLGSLPASQQDLLAQALAYCESTQTSGVGRVLQPPRDGNESASLQPPQTTQGATVMPSPSDNELRLTIPIEIIMRIGSAPVQTAAIAAEPPVAAKTLSRAAEAVKVDQDYDNRPGYQPSFIPGVKIPLPAMNDSLQKQLAPLRAEELHAEEGELKYEHFSIKMNKGKRIAIFTATNIDGKTYLDVDRTTGQVKDSEGETWFKDPRISASFFLDQDFYSAWSTYFDRGHLTRRTDPTWGDPGEAERANADTYHFTNCSPQHFRFNESAKFWQGAERYVLENGLLTADSQKRITVFQGPIFNRKIDLWADDVQIPSSFFKVVLWKGADGLKAVGLIVDQLALLSEPRKSLGAPKDLPSVDASHWRVPIKQIEDKTGLDFGDAVRNADTISSNGQPLVGGEAARLIRSFADLLS